MTAARGGPNVTGTAVTQGHKAAPSKDLSPTPAELSPSPDESHKCFFLSERLSRGILAAPALAGDQSLCWDPCTDPGKCHMGECGAPSLLSDPPWEQHTIKTSKARWFVSNSRAGSCHLSGSSPKGSGMGPSQNVSHTVPGSGGKSWIYLGLQHCDTTAVSLGSGEMGLEQIVAVRKQIREK